MKYVISITCRNLANGYLEWTAQLLTYGQATNLPQDTLRQFSRQLNCCPGVVTYALSHDALVVTMDLKPGDPAQRRRLFDDALNLVILGITADGRMPFEVHFSQGRPAF